VLAGEEAHEIGRGVDERAVDHLHWLRTLLSPWQRKSRNLEDNGRIGDSREYIEVEQEVKYAGTDSLPRGGGTRPHTAPKVSPTTMQRVSDSTASPDPCVIPLWRPFEKTLTEPSGACPCLIRGTGNPE
jgi:hypothetical protein